MTKRASVFINYAQPDGMDFVRRLGFALDMYMDVYWDRRLQSGDLPADLRQQIDTHDHFVWVLTPYALAGDWNRSAFNHAQAQGKPILLAKVYAGDTTLEGQYTTGDFSTDFEAGFRTLTTTITGQPYSSWETLSGAPVNVLLNYLKAGAVPAVIAKQIGEWVIVEKLWGMVKTELSHKRNAKIIHGTPLTAIGILSQSKALLEPFEKAKDTNNSRLMKQVIAIAERFTTDLLPLAESDHRQGGQLASAVISETKAVLEAKQTSERNFEKLAIIQKYYDFDVTEQLRVLINDHARRSRPLY